MNHRDSQDISRNVEQFLQRCTLLMVQQQVYISHACSSLGYKRLSSMWFSKALDNIDDLELKDVKEKAKVILRVMSLIKRENGSDGRKTCSLDRMSLYEGGFTVLTGGYNGNPRLVVHFALATLQKGLPKSVMFLNMPKVYDTPSPSYYYKEFLHAINAQVIFQVAKGAIHGAIQEMHRRLDVVSKWIGNNSFELATDHHRLGCFYSIIGHHEKSVKHLEESLKIGASYADYDALDSITLLATTYDAIHETDDAIQHYERALSMANDITSKVRLMNALSRLLIKIGGQSQRALDYLVTAIRILQDDENTERSRDDNILLGTPVGRETMILFGDAMGSFSEAIDWCESVLSSADKSDTAPVLNAIGSMYFVINDYSSAIKHFTQSLSLENECFSQRQRAGTLCNVASAYHRMQNYEESEKYLNEALSVANKLGEASVGLRETIMCKLACILYERKCYFLAHKLFSDGKNIRGLIILLSVAF